jgi:carboxyl-terminal processing protease
MNKFVKYSLIGIVAIVILLGTFSGGVIVGAVSAQTFPQFMPQTLPPETDNPQFAPQTPAPAPTDTETLFAPFWETWTIIHENYVEQPIDDRVLMQGAIRGMLDTLTFGRNYYMTPEEAQESNDMLNGKDYEGIGAYVNTEGEYLTVIAPIKGSPAEKAGIRPGDMIIAIDGADMTGITPENARLKVLGPAGSDVVLTIFRPKSEETLDITITRAKIVVPLVEYEMRGDGIAYVKLNTFGDSASSELRNALSELLAQNPKGLIFDLRNNGGGYLTQAIEVASEFLPKDQIVAIEEYGDGEQDVYKSSGEGLAINIPMVIIVNEGTASASEIVAGALQDQARAKLIGVTTFGKGSVQLPMELQNSQGIVAVTIAKWLTPNKQQIDKLGLTPDFVVELTQEDYDADLDPQLDKAIEVLMGLISSQ